MTAQWSARAATAVAGGLPVLVFPEPGLWWLAPVVLVPVLLLLRAAPTTREAALRGWVAGAGFVATVHHWLLPVTGPFLALAAVVVGLLWLPWGVLVHHCLRAAPTLRSTLAATGLVPAGWLGIELVRSWEYLGGPWGLLGTSLWQVPAALDVAALGGVWLVSALLVAINVALAILFTPGAGAARVAAVAVVLGIAGAVTLWSQLWDDGTTDAAQRRVVRVAAVQPGTVSGAEARFDAGEDLTRALVGQELDLVVWAESSVALDLESRPDLEGRLAQLSAEVGAPLIVNVDARRSTGGGILKSSVLVDTRGVQDSYDKTRLVPFGEFIPLRPLFGWLGAVTDAADEDRLRGDRLRVLRAGDVDVGPLVCFESAFPDLGRRLATEGAELIVVQASTWTFQDSWAPEQHAALASVRAAESGRPVLQATLTGQTSVFDARGRQLGDPMTTAETGATVYDVPLARPRTPYATVGDVVPVLAVLALLAYAAVTAGSRDATRPPMPVRIAGRVPSAGRSRERIAGGKSIQTGGPP